METIVETNKITNGAITADQINGAFVAAMDALSVVSQATREFVLRSVIVGELLKSKRSEFPPRAGWLEWLKNNCPDISQPTSHRLIEISDLYYSGGNNMPLPARLSSVRELYDAMHQVAVAIAPAPPIEGGAPPQPSRVVVALSRFWGTITRRPPEAWDEMERVEFLSDYSARGKLIAKQGWKTIDI